MTQTAGLAAPAMDVLVFVCMYNVVLTDGISINLHQEMSYESIIREMSF